MVSDPDSYVPQEVALGPYYYWRPELYEMERIRSCYHKYLNFNGETLAWMMAVDASFLLEFLRIYAVKEVIVLTRAISSSTMPHLVDVAGRKSAHNAILRDLAMLENQIPLFVLRKILIFRQYANVYASRYLQRTFPFQNGGKNHSNSSHRIYSFVGLFVPNDCA
ncbi:hypothetical protein RDI58_009024 [Solanum bulbocastanum]|uniref:Uncharacterized protein n=1 Tax=Solanum bulbocastanum TaxID=147425 RepID=A0AAN8TX86_SOLBU